MKKRVYYEFRTLQGNQTLILEKPAQVTFQYLGSIYGQCHINQGVFLEPRQFSLSSTYKFPFQVTLNNNENEEDRTIYTIRFFGYLGNQLRAIIKYYEN
jgi:hypothetical protein